MPIDFRGVSFRLDTASGLQRLNSSVRFDSPVLNAAAALQAFHLDYASSDHHINVVRVAPSVTSFGGGNTVTVHLECNYADKNVDDAYSGIVDVLVIAEVE